MNGRTRTFKIILVQLLSSWLLSCSWILSQNTWLFLSFINKRSRRFGCNDFRLIGHLTEVLIKDIFLKFFHVVIMYLFDFLVYLLRKISKFIEGNRYTDHFFICNDVFEFVNVLINRREDHLHS